MIKIKKIITTITIITVLISITSIMQAEELATVIGQITGSGNRPAARLVVTLGETFKFTDSNGRFRIRGVPFGRHILKIFRRNVLIKEEEININENFMRISIRLSQ